MTAIEFNNVSKQYRLGLVSTGTLAHDLNRFWQTKILRREDPYLKIGETNDRASKGASKYVWALKDIDFKVEQGDVVGIIGRNGAGKSTLLKLLSRVTSPTTGSIRARGRIASLLEVGTGFHPEMTGRENIYMNGSIMGMTRAEITRKLDEIVDFSGCERYLDTPVKRYSSGMSVRLGFAIAAHLEPEILVVDEVLAVGDAEFQKKACGKMQDVAHGQGRTVLFVSHNMRSVRSLCKSGIVLKNGSIDFVGTAEECVDHYTKNAGFDKVDQVAISKLPRERHCTGKIKFTGLRFLNENDEERNPHCGRCVKVKLDFECSCDVSRVVFAVAIRSAAGDVIFALPSDIVHSNYQYKPGRHSLTMTIPRLPLTQGIYNIELYAGIKGETYDRLECARQMTVEDDDFFGNGRMPGSWCHGKIALCDYKWGD